MSSGAGIGVRYQQRDDALRVQAQPRVGITNADIAVRKRDTSPYMRRLLEGLPVRNSVRFLEHFAAFNVDHASLALSGRQIAILNCITNSHLERIDPQSFRNHVDLGFTCKYELHHSSSAKMAARNADGLYRVRVDFAIRNAVRIAVVNGG